MLELLLKIAVDLDMKDDKEEWELTISTLDVLEYAYKLNSTIDDFPKHREYQQECVSKHGRIGLTIITMMAKKTREYINDLIDNFEENMVE